MDIPYGFDCYAFTNHEVKYFEPNIVDFRTLGVTNNSGLNTQSIQKGYLNESSGDFVAGHVRFTRKNEDFTREQLTALALAGRFNISELGKRVFCGPKIQIGIAAVTNFLQKGMQYRSPIGGRNELINGSWTGIVSGLTRNRDANDTYDMAFGNFLAYDQQYPYIKFGPFFAIESKLVMLTGGSRRVEEISFGAKIRGDFWALVLIIMLGLSVMASVSLRWNKTRLRIIETAYRQILASCGSSMRLILARKKDRRKGVPHFLLMLQEFFFIYYTMLLNKPSVEFDNLVWPRPQHTNSPRSEQWSTDKSTGPARQARRSLRSSLFIDREPLRLHYEQLARSYRSTHRRHHLPTTIRVLSYIWSAACFVFYTIYSGEMLADVLSHADQNIDTISQLINSNPPIEPVIRQDDFTYNLMLKSLDENMLRLHNITKIIPRPEVYTRRFIESVSQRKQALLGDDELIETIYETYHKNYDLYRSKVTYLQYPISIMYRKDLNTTLELKLRRGMVQMFEMGLVHRWYQAQKETFINFYNTENKDQESDGSKGPATNADEKALGGQRYKPFSMKNFKSIFPLMYVGLGLSSLALVLEMIHSFRYTILARQRITSKEQ